MDNLRCSIIIPIYNAEEHIERCIKILQRQIKKDDIEILLIDDGSMDNSGALCDKMTHKYSNVICFHQKNSGVSAARNVGIKNARGKYLFYLDADDLLEDNSIQAILNYFDSIYEEVDLVTYPIETVFNKKVLKPHFRYRYLNKTGVYDLREHPYIGQTTMNIVVKNKFQNNILFEERQTFSEDQRYCCQVLADKLKMGFCKEAKYIYYRSPDSASGKLSGACFIFEQCMKMFEDIFSWYKDAVPAAFQGLYVNDIYWKLMSNILFPYHYKETEFVEAKQRVINLLRRCDETIILNHPQMDFFEKFYLIKLMGGNRIQTKVTLDYYLLQSKTQVAVCENSMELVMTKFAVHGDIIEISGFLKTVFFNFYNTEPTLCVVENDGKMTRKIKLFSSKHNYYCCHEETQNFWAMQYSCNVNEVHKIRFEVEVGGYWFPIHYYFMPLVPFSHNLKKYIYEKENVRATVDKNNEILLDKMEKQSLDRIWLYYDCRGVARDNGLLQFEHDILKDDGIKRYYVVSDDKQKSQFFNKENCVRFGSLRHKHLFLNTEKVITAYIENNNVIPFESTQYDMYANCFRFDVIYLQHGVLHIKMPWKYTPEKIIADKVVVSTEQERQLFIENGFRDNQLWKYKMPRFDLVKKDEVQKKKILYAPSWRSYLVGNNGRDGWEILEKKFLTSKYYMEIYSFLNSAKLHYFLKENDYVLDVKLHPIFQKYIRLFSGTCNNVHFLETSCDESEYELFITDFSSYLYDFVYRDVPIISFIPDHEEFKCGMNGYRDLNWPEEFKNAVVVTAEKLVERIVEWHAGVSMPKLRADFFDCEFSREAIYQELMEENDFGIECNY